MLPYYQEAVMALTRTSARVAAVGSLGGLALLLAAPAAVAATESVTNGSFQAPGTNGADPTGWTATNLGAETAPFRASIATYDATGQFPPPMGTPGGDTAGNFASESFYQVGSATGVIGYGGRQVLTTPVSSASAPKVGFSTVESFFPSNTKVSWAGAVLQLELSSGASTDTLRYVAPFAAGGYSGTPSDQDTSTTKTVVLPAIPAKVWSTTAALDVAADASSRFGLSRFTITAVTYGDLENRTSAGGSPFPNITTYWKDVSLTAGNTPPAALPDAAQAVLLPLVGLGALVAVVAVRRSRRA